MTRKEYQKQRRACLIHEGFCSKCLVRLVREGNKTCDECRKYNNLYHAENREKRREHKKEYNALKAFLDACVIYAIDISGYRYIGSTHTWEKRKKNWYWKLKHNLGSNPRLQALYNQHGKDALTFTILATLSKDTTKLARRAIEQTYIDDTSPAILLNENCACRIDEDA